MVIRLDKGYLNKSEFLPNGMLKTPAFVTRTGVFIYKKIDGTVTRELRLPEEVFNESSMKTLALVPVTNEHPPVLLDSKNAMKYSIGSTGETIEKEQNYLKTNLVVFDEKVINEINAGKQECSCGYECDIDETSGNFEGQVYDCIQRNIKYNHVAIVTKGRAGDAVKLKLDSQDAICQDQSENQTYSENYLKRSNSMKLKLGKKEYDVEEEIGKAFHEHISAMKKDMEEELEKKYKKVGNDDKKAKDEDEDEDKKDKKKKDCDKKKDDSIDVLQAKIDMLEAELKTRSDSDSINSRVQARIRVLEVAKKVIKSEINLDSMSDIEIMKEVVKNDISIEGKNNQYVEAAFDIYCERQKRIDSNLKNVGKFVADSTLANADLLAKKDKEVNPEEARRKSMEEDALRYKK